MTAFFGSWFFAKTLIIFLWLVFIASALVYFFKEEILPRHSQRFKFFVLALAAIAFRFLYAGMKTFGQYYVWSKDDFTKLLLPPYQPLSYFIFYSWGRFWFNFVLSIAAAAVFYLFLKILKKYKERFFEKGEIELGFISALIAGWPGIFIFAPLAFVIMLFTSIYRRVFLHERYTTLGMPFLAAVLIMLVWSGYFMPLFNLWIFRI